MEEVRVEELLGKIQELMTTKQYRILKLELADIYPMDLAEIFEDLSTEDGIILFRLLHKNQAAEVFSYLAPHVRKKIVSSIQESQLQYILSELYFDDKIDFLEEMPANFVKSLLANSPAEERQMINQFLNYPENSAGSLMTIEYVDLKKQMTVRQALERIKQVGVDKETIYTCYVLDETRRLEGLLSLRRLVLSDEESMVGDIMHTDLVVAQVGDDQEEIAENFKKYDLMAIPVVDGEKRMIGIITIDDIVDVIEQENTEDFHKMAAMAPSDEEYLDTGVLQLAKSRIVWLLVLMLSATFTGAIMTQYEDLLSVAVVLTASIPMLMDSGGNAGSQSSTLIIRSMALGELGLADLGKVVWKELRVGVVVGLALMAANMLRMQLFGNAWNVTITVSLTLLCTIIGAKLTGGVLPLLAKAVKLDPAIMASPLITTIVDAVSLIIYFNIAKVLVL
jgi:Mg2+ transporter (mgtE)